MADRRIVTIEEYRIRADGHPQYEGQTPPQWCDEEGEWHDVWIRSDSPVAARVGVYRQGFREPMWGIATYAEYVQRNRQGKVVGWWAKGGGAHMLAKCAEALGLRKTFPKEFQGTYTHDEMAQAHVVDDDPAPPQPEPERIEKGLKPVEKMNGQEIREEFSKHNERLGDKRFNTLVPEHPKTLGAARLALSILRECPTDEGEVAPKRVRMAAENNLAMKEDAAREEMKEYRRRVNEPVSGVPPDIKLCANEGCGAPLPKGRRDELCETCRINEAQAAAIAAREGVYVPEDDHETAWGAAEEMEDAVSVMQEAKEAKAEAEREEAKARHEAREKKPWEKHTVAPGRAE